ncbi:MAG: hypothetical protein KY454_07130 [Actinobacteria bacterium]|nr:hypothetical protein [Actinomycetota bacterium]MBW3649990.1 hypothetical protein [Actinomycetota bacterium]
MTTDGPRPEQDPVLVRRAQMSRLASTGNRIGYACVAVSVVAFFVGLSAGYEVWGRVVVVALAASALTLAPAIVLGYAVKAADREDRSRRLP